jgi:hypothetical protein
VCVRALDSLPLILVPVEEGCSNGREARRYEPVAHNRHGSEGEPLVGVGILLGLFHVGLRLVSHKTVFDAGEAAPVERTSMVETAISMTGVSPSAAFISSGRT